MDVASERTRKKDANNLSSLSEDFVKFWGYLTNAHIHVNVYIECDNLKIYLKSGAKKF